MCRVSHYSVTLEHVTSHDPYIAHVHIANKLCMKVHTDCMFMEALSCFQGMTQKCKTERE